jgi:hypothetical protein
MALVAPLLGVIFIFVEAAAPYAVKLNVRECRAASPALLSTLGDAWRALSSYAQDCPVLGPDGKVALTVAILRIDRMEQQHYFDAHHDPRIPLPVLLDASLGHIGKLPEGFPVDLPGALQVTFTDWRGGMPKRIDQYEAFETALPPHDLPAQSWDGGKHQFLPLP